MVPNVPKQKGNSNFPRPLVLPVRGTQRESWKRSPGKVRSQMFPMFLGFHKWGIPKSWSVYTGKSWKIHENKLDENWGYHHFRKLPSVMMYAQFSSFFYRCRIVFPYIIYIYIHKYLSVYIYIWGGCTTKGWNWEVDAWFLHQGVATQTLYWFQGLKKCRMVEWKISGLSNSHFLWTN
jgi:hypothetical protein